MQTENHLEEQKVYFATKHENSGNKYLQQTSPAKTWQSMPAGDIASQQSYGISHSTLIYSCKND